MIVTFPCIYLAAPVDNIALELIPPNSVDVAWDLHGSHILDIKTYRVYYKQMQSSEPEEFVEVPASENSVTINNLDPKAEYQYQVVPKTDLQPPHEFGQRSLAKTAVISSKNSSVIVFSSISLYASSVADELVALCLEI